MVIAAHRSVGISSPNREVLSHWRAGAFTLLYSEDVLLEYVEKSIALGVPDESIVQWVSAIARLAERVSIAFFHLRRYPQDTDDIAFLLCAMNGNATHLVTYDQGLSDLAADCSFSICQPLAFLAELRSAPKT